MKVLTNVLALALAVVVVYAEPPVPSYSTTHQDAFSPPPISGPSASYGAPPSAAYGPPSSGRFGGNHRQTQAVLRPSASYGAPSGHGGSGFDSSFGGNSGFRPGGGFGGHKNRGGGARRPSASYGAPSTGYGAPSAGGYDDGSSGPASYKFSYHVQDAASGNDFGHQESREGHQATGMYMVLLPDGRRQIVEYTADESGYHPIVRYEGTATTASGGGYPSGPSGSGGYRY
ncbi:pro-resilin-like [Homalodisca vitripennis]|uniref:pro-resilin-like n=1 Tax=Homalodisca vitripennis TaxID=197043 RepID=UPI001EEAE9F5|nr:pro-resilin-like [Homalodisca vitripennis]